MASLSFQQKSASKSSPEWFEKLLMDGARYVSAPEVRQAAERLVAQGIISLEEREYVLCANARDPEDFRFVRNRDCRGRIYIEDGFDLFGDDYLCPDCGRRLFPAKKTRYRELHVRILQQGVRSYIESVLTQGGLSWKEMAPWLYRVDVGHDEVWLCVVDFCESSQHMTREWALANRNRTLWLVVHPRGKRERFLQEEWISRVSLGELFDGREDLMALLETQARCEAPSLVGSPSLPIYNRNGRHPSSEIRKSAQPKRLFVVQITDGIVLVNGHSVIPKQAVTGYPIFQILLKHYLQDMIESLPSGTYAPLSTKDICGEIYNLTGKEFNDEDAVRKTINRIQNNIETVIKRETGDPIDRCDVIETLRWKGAGEGDHGYRLNPSSVAIRPFISSNTKT
jgi:hypothetical protein